MSMKSQQNVKDWFVRYYTAIVIMDEMEKTENKRLKELERVQ